MSCSIKQKFEKIFPAIQGQGHLMILLLTIHHIISLYTRFYLSDCIRFVCPVCLVVVLHITKFGCKQMVSSEDNYSQNIHILIVFIILTVA